MAVSLPSLAAAVVLLLSVASGAARRRRKPFPGLRPTLPDTWAATDSLGRSLPAANPTDPQWGPSPDFHWWAEPFAGCYRSDDPWVIRRYKGVRPLPAPSAPKFVGAFADWADVTPEYRNDPFPARKTWVDPVRVPLHLDGKRLSVAIPRVAVKGFAGRLDFEFKWADNVPLDRLTSPAEFMDGGDVAPDARFNYVFTKGK